MQPDDQTQTSIPSLICTFVPSNFRLNNEAMRQSMFLLGLILLLGCNTKNPIQENPKNESSTGTNPYELNFLNEIKKKTPPFELDLSLDQISPSLLTLTATLVLANGDYVVSPNTSQDFLGVFDFSILDSTKLRFVGEFIAFPPPQAFLVPFDDQPVLSFVGSTRISRSVEILSNDDFEGYGEIFFVHEPSCYPYVISFVISRKLGNVFVTKLGTEIPKY